MTNGRAAYLAAAALGVRSGREQLRQTLAPVAVVRAPFRGSQRELRPDARRAISFVQCISPCVAAGSRRQGTPFVGDWG